jgi:hypothetical protein
MWKLAINIAVSFPPAISLLHATRTHARTHLWKVYVPPFTFQLLKHKTQHYNIFLSQIPGTSKGTTLFKLIMPRPLLLLLRAAVKMKQKVQKPPSQCHSSDKSHTDWAETQNWHRGVNWRLTTRAKTWSLQHNFIHTSYKNLVRTSQ